MGCRYHGCRPAADQSRAGEVGSKGCDWSVVGLSEQAVEVAGQAGGGAHSVVTQDMDGIVQAIQTVLHTGLHREREREREKERHTQRPSGISICSLQT